MSSTAQSGRLTVKNWHEFQHYKDRAPPWIKLHKGLLDDFKYQRLPVASRALAPMIWLLASESKDGSVDADPEQLAFRLRTTEQEVIDGIKPLIEAGFLIADSATLAPCYQDACLEERQRQRQRQRRDREENTVEPTALPPGKPADRLIDSIRTVFDYWREKTGHRHAKLDAKREKAVRARLKDGYTLEQLQQAVDGIMRSPFHQGQNDRAQIYDDLELVCRSAKHVDQFIAIATAPDLSGMSAAGRQTASAAQQWLEETA